LCELEILGESLTCQNALLADRYGLKANILRLNVLQAGRYVVNKLIAVVVRDVTKTATNDINLSTDDRRTRGGVRDATLDVTGFLSA
jgi:hypothetical protein